MIDYYTGSFTTIARYLPHFVHTVHMCMNVTLCYVHYVSTCASRYVHTCRAMHMHGCYTMHMRAMSVTLCSHMYLNIHSFIHSFIHSGHFYSAHSSHLPLRGAPDYSTDTVSEFHAEAHRQVQVKDLPKVPT